MTCAIYSDFDGTITKKDTVNTFFEGYADASWVESEKAWLDGRITSRENAQIQVGLVRPMTEETLNAYIETIELDDGFLDFYRYIRRQGIRLTILSDGFDLFIERTLKKYGIGDIPFFANHLVHREGRFSIAFPHYTATCRNGAGMCKCAQVTDGDYCYIGDGASDLCVARNARVLFASKYLDRYCNEHAIRHVPFNDFRDIRHYFEQGGTP